MHDVPHEQTVTADASDDASFDALDAAPDHHTLLFENAHVRILDTSIRPGEQTPVHTHRWPAARYILSWSHFVRHDATGAVLLDSRTVPTLASPPSALWSAPLSAHSLRNVGESEMRVITVEVKD